MENTQVPMSIFCCPVYNYGNSCMRMQRGKLEIKCVLYST